MNKDLTITVSVDSSYKDNYGACAYYIKHDKFIIKDTEFLGKIESSTKAEFEGICRAVNRMIREIGNRRISTLYLTCDCIYALQEFEKLFSNNKNKFNPIKVIYCQHIDAHTPIKSDRQWMNNWCDKSARDCLFKNLS